MKFFKKLEESMWGIDEDGRRIYYPWGRPGEAFYINKKLEKYLKIINTILGVLFFLTIFLVIYLVNEKIISFDESDIIISGFFLFLPILFLFELFLFSRVCKPYVIPKDKRESKSIKTWVYFSVIPILMFLDFNAREENFLKQEASVIFLLIYILGIYVMAFFIKKTKGYIFNK